MVKRTFQFGKISAYKNGRKENEVELEVELRKNKDGFPELSVVGAVWNRIHTDWVMGGQCLDDIQRVPMNNSLFQEIKGLWKKYHLNGMHAGTKAQELALKKAGLYGVSNYSQAVEFLKRKGLYEVNLTPIEKKYNPRYADKPYKYGHGWLYHPIPAADLAKIRRILEMKV